MKYNTLNELGDMCTHRCAECNHAGQCDVVTDGLAYLPMDALARIVKREYADMTIDEIVRRWK